MINTWLQVKAERLVKTLTKRKVDTGSGTVDFHYTKEEVDFLFFLFLFFLSVDSGNVGIIAPYSIPL